jgi:hypothetical protein
MIILTFDGRSRYLKNYHPWKRKNKKKSVQMKVQSMSPV